MARHPFTWPAGQVPSLRASLHAKLALAASIAGSTQYAGLEDGRAVAFTTEQLRSFYPQGDEHPSLPPDLDAAEAWVLRGDDTLEPL